MNARRIVFSAVRFCDRHPFLLAGVCLTLNLLAWAGGFVMLSNKCQSSLRLWPELTDRQMVFFWDFSRLFSAGAIYAGALSLALPLVPLVFRRWRTASQMIVMAFVVTAIVWGGTQLLFGSIDGYLRGDVRVAKINLARQAEAVRNGSGDCVRLPYSRLERTDWYFDDGRYLLAKMRDGTFCLTDMRYEALNKSRTLWRDRVLVDNVIVWKDLGDSLLVVSSSKGTLVLDYRTGDVRPFTTTEVSK